MLLLNILGIIALVIIFILALIILVPYTYIIDGNSIERNVELSISWLFGIIKISFYKYFGGNDELIVSFFNFSKYIDISSSKEPKEKKNSKKNTKESVKDNKKRNNVSWKNHINKAVVNELITLIKKLWRRARPQTINIDAKVGFEDPMYTGLLYGSYCSFSFLFKKDSVKLQPIFNEKVLEGKLFIHGSIWIAYLLMVVLRFLLSLPIRKEIKLIRKEKKGGAQDVR